MFWVSGKFLTSALSKFYIHEKDNGIVEIADSVFFLQILDSKKLKVGSVKQKQFLSLDESIQEIIPLKGSRINRYRLFTGKQDENFHDMIDFIKTEVAS